MPYYEVANLVTVTKTNMIDKMPCAYWTLRTTALTIQHKVSRRAAQRSQLFQNLTRTYCNVLSQLATMPKCSFTIGYRQSEKKHRNCDWRVICKVMCGTGDGGGVIYHRDVSDGSDGALPLRRSQSCRMEMFIADAPHYTPPTPLLSVQPWHIACCGNKSCHLLIIRNDTAATWLYSCTHSGSSKLVILLSQQFITPDRICPHLHSYVPLTHFESCHNQQMKMISLIALNIKSPHHGWNQSHQISRHRTNKRMLRDRIMQMRRECGRNCVTEGMRSSETQEWRGNPVRGWRYN